MFHCKVTGEVVFKCSILSAAFQAYVTVGRARVYFGWSRPGLSRHSFHPEMKSNSLDIMNATLKRPEMIQYVHWISCMLFGTFQDRDKQWDLFMVFLVSPPKFQLNW